MIRADRQHTLLHNLDEPIMSIRGEMSDDRVGIAGRFCHYFNLFRARAKL
jgi:predicted 2-oxoglutarate/Fe(II)-dependent dioxygenase YbiX